MNKQNAADFSQGSVGSRIMAQAIPLSLAEIVQLLYNIVDRIFLGHLPDGNTLALTGVGLIFPVVSIVAAFTSLYSSGGAPIFAMARGRKDEERALQIQGTVFALLLGSSLALTVLCYLLKRPLLFLFGASEDSFVFADAYLKIYLLGTPFTMLATGMNPFINAQGRPKIGMMTTVIGAVLNLALDPLFIYGFHMGVTGAAVATVITEAVSSLVLLVILLRSRDSYRLILRKIRLDLPLLGDILRIGFPAGLQSVMYAVSNVFIQTNINAFGTDVVAGWTAYGKIDSLFWMVMDAFGISITTFTGQNIGARKLDRVRQGIRTCSLMAFGFSFALSGLLFVFGDQIVRLFNNDAGVVSAAGEMMRCAYPYFFTYVLICVLGGAMRGAGDSLKPMLMVAGGICLFRIVWIAVAHSLGAYVTAMIYSYPTSWAFTSVLFVVYYKRGTWLTHARALQA